MSFTFSGTDLQPWTLCTSHWVYDGTAYPCSHVHAALQPLGAGYPGRVTLSDLVQGVRRRDSYWLNLLWTLVRQCSAACLEELAGCRPLVTTLTEELVAATNTQQHVQKRTCNAPPWADPYYGPQAHLQQQQQQQQQQPGSQQQPQQAGAGLAQQQQPPPATQQPSAAPQQQQQQKEQQQQQRQKELVPCWSYTVWVLGRLLSVQPQQSPDLYTALLSLHHTCSTWQHVAAHGIATCLLATPDNSARLLATPAHLAAVLVTAVNAATQRDDVTILTRALTPAVDPAASAPAAAGPAAAAAAAGPAAPAPGAPPLAPAAAAGPAALSLVSAPGTVAAAHALLAHQYVQQALAACVQGCTSSEASLGPLLVSLSKSPEGRAALRAGVQTKGLCVALLNPDTPAKTLISYCKVAVALLVNEVNPESALTAPNGLLAAAVAGLGRCLQLWAEGPVVHTTWNSFQSLAENEELREALLCHHSDALAAALISGLRQRRAWLAAATARPEGPAPPILLVARVLDQWLGSCLAAVRQLLGAPDGLEWCVQQEEVLTVLRDVLKSAVMGEEQGLPRWLSVLGLLCEHEVGRAWVCELIPVVDWSVLGGVSEFEEDGSIALWYDAEQEVWGQLQMDPIYRQALLDGLASHHNNWIAAATRHLTLPGGEVWVEGTEGLQEVLGPALLAWVTPPATTNGDLARITRELCDSRLARLLGCRGGRAALGASRQLLKEAGARLGAALADPRSVNGLRRLRTYPNWLRPLLGPAESSDDSGSEGAQREPPPVGPGVGFLEGFLSGPCSRPAGDLMVALMTAPHPAAWVLSEPSVLDAALLGLASLAPLVAGGAPDIVEMEAGPQLTLLVAVDPVKLVPLVVDRLRSSEQSMAAAALCALQHLSLYRPGAQALVVSTFQEMSVAAGQVMRLQQLEAGAYEAVMGLAAQHAEARVAVTAADAAARRVGWRRPQQQAQQQKPPWEFSFWRD